MSKNLPHSKIYESTRNGRTIYRLVCRDNHLCNFFDEWTYTLAKHHKYRTVKAYANAVKRFINYYLEAEDQLGGSISELQLYFLLENFESYLAYGCDSDIDLIKKVGRAVPPGTLSSPTIEQTITALNNFIKASESFRKSVLQLQESGYIDANNFSTNSILSSLDHTSPSQSVQKAVRQSSWLAGCLNGGLKTIKQSYLKPKSKASSIIFADELGGDEKTFPFDLAKELIESARNLRDKLLWSLIAASGIRISEAQTMFESDIVIKTASTQGKLGKQKRVLSKKVFVIDPDTRKSELIKYLSESGINQLPHKGREQPDTYLIEPFASMFWRYLAQYKVEENKKLKRRKVGAKHPFLFKLTDTGLPVINSYQTLYDSFSYAAEKLTGKKYSFHSLRHMYGYYVHNFAPVGPGKFGLSLKEVQLLLGHKDIKSTKRYARQDMMKLEAAIGVMNMAQSSDPDFSIDRARLEYLRSQVSELESRIERKKLGELKND